jgi:hypothetical protein
MRNNISFKILSLLVSVSTIVFGQYGYNHPELVWNTIEGEHFIVHYHQGTEWTANEALFVAEDIYPAITGLYGYEPESKTHLIIKDTDDFANGGAYYFDNKIEIWAMPLDYELRGSHYWLRDVISHEFTHIISLRASRKLSGNMPAGYFQIVQYEPDKRDDVLYGYPNGLIAYPLPSVTVPMWWAEGIAQHQSNDKRFDYWDSVRDMLTRDRIHHGKLFTFAEMDGFGKEGIGNESVYNQGFMFVNYLAKRFGEQVLQDITNYISNPMSFNFYAGIASVTGHSAQSLYDDWVQEMNLDYESILKSRSLSNINMIQKEGIENRDPKIRPETSELTYISNSGQSYMSLTHLEKYVDGEHTELVLSAEGYDWSPNGNELVVVKKEFYDGPFPGSEKHDHSLIPHETCERCLAFHYSGSKYRDVFIYSGEDFKDEIQITSGARAKYPAWSPKDSLIAFINLRDGTNNICTVESKENGVIIQLTDFLPGTQVYTLNFSPDGRHIIYDYTRGFNRDIAILDIKTREIEIVTNQKWDERMPYWANDSTVYYSDDRTSIFNIYQYNLNSKELTQITNVVGGAFTPYLDNDTLYFSLFDDCGFNIVSLEKNEFNNMSSEISDVYTNRILDVKWEAHQTTKNQHPYTIQYGPMFLVPRVQIDIDQNKHKTNPKIGMYFFSNEILNNYTVLGGADIGLNRDMDLFFITEFKKLWPTLSAEVYYMKRHTREELIYGVYPAEADLTFTLVQGVFSAIGVLPGGHLITADIKAANYNTAIGTHLVEGLQGGGTSYDYFRGYDYGLRWKLNRIALRRERNINPSGYTIDTSIRKNHHDFLDTYGYNEDTGLWSDIYNTFVYHNINISAFYGHLMSNKKNVVLSSKLDLAFIDDSHIDDFFWEFGGGMPGLRGYPFYSMNGTRKVLSSTMLRFPLARDIFKKFGHYTLQNIYVGFEGQIGSTWQGQNAKWNDSDLKQIISNDVSSAVWLRDLGSQLRVSGFSFYAFPTAFEFGAYYGIDTYHWEDSNSTDTIEYGKEWRYYWKLLFQFD